MLPGERFAPLHPYFVVGLESCLSFSVSLCLCGYFRPARILWVQLRRRLLTVFEMNSRSRHLFTTAAVYLSVIATVFAFNAIRLRVLSRSQVSSLAPERNLSDKPFFSLSTNRTFAPGEHARLSASYQGIDHLDFRVYQIKDPVKFFKQLDDPHQLGEKQKEEVSGNYGNRPSVLERTHSLKTFINTAIKDYVREQLQRDHREAFNLKFRKDNEPARTPLNVADYARVPLLNPQQMVSAWREKLPRTENQYDWQTISLGKRDAGVYLIEAVNGDLRAYSIAIVSNLTMIQKTTKDGQVVVYVVDRKSGAPHQGVKVEVTKGA